MVDAHAVQHAAMQPVQNQRMGLVEHMFPFNSQPDQRVHVEKAPIPKLLVCCLPVRKPVVLLIQEIVEPIRILVQLRHCLVQRIANRRLFQAQPSQQPLQHELVPFAHEDCLSVRVFRSRQPGKGCRRENSAYSTSQSPPPAPQSPATIVAPPAVAVPSTPHGSCCRGVLPGCRRPSTLFHIDPPESAPALYSAASPRTAASQYRRTKRTGSTRRSPARRSNIGSPCQRHVIGHDVQHLPQPGLAQSLAEPFVRSGSSQLGVHSLVVHYVVAVLALRFGLLQIRRAIHVPRCPAGADSLQCSQHHRR